MGVPHVFRGNVAACITLPSHQMGRNVGAPCQPLLLAGSKGSVQGECERFLLTWSFPFMRAHEGV